DRDKREKMWHRLQENYAEDLPALPLYCRANPHVWPLWLEGVTPTGQQYSSALPDMHWLNTASWSGARSAMLRYFGHRVLEAAVVLLLMSFCIYGLIGLMPGDPLDLMLSGDPDITSEDIARLRALYGLDRPLHERYWEWLQEAVRGNFGYSRVHARPTLEVLLPRLGNTALLMGASLLLAFAFALPAGIVAALRPRSWYDYTLNLFAFAGISVPSFWLALLLILLFAVQLGWLPAGGVQTVGVDRLGDRILHLVLPVLTLTVLTAGGLLRFTRAAMIEALRQDYILTARAKGLA